MGTHTPLAHGVHQLAKTNSAGSRAHKGCHALQPLGLQLKNGYAPYA